MHECEYVKAHIDRWLDGELEAAESGRFESHIAACSSCATLIELERSISADLVSLDGVANRIAHEGAIAEQAPRRRRRAWPAAAAIVLLVGVGFLATWLTNDTPAGPDGNGRDIVRKPVVADPIQLSILLPDDDSRLSVRIPSDDPQVKIIWLFETTQARSNLPADIDVENVGPGDAAPTMNRS